MRAKTRSNPSPSRSRGSDAAIPTDLFPRLDLSRAILADFDTAARFEWLETNGLGGYALQSVSGALTRRYSGLLVAAIRPPVARQLVLAGLDECLEEPAGGRWPLTVQRFPDAAGSPQPGILHPDGHHRLESFDRYPFPRHTWLAGPHRLERRLVMIHGANALLLRYRLLDGVGPVRLVLRPLLSFRDHHGVRHADAAEPAPFAAHSPSPGRVTISLGEGAPDLRLRGWRGGASAGRGGTSAGRGGAAAWADEPLWMRQVIHDREVERGMDDRDDYFAPGTLSVRLVPGGGYDLLVALGQLPAGTPGSLEGRELDRRAALLLPVRRRPEWVRALHLAADQFLVRRGARQRTIVAGYPWFTDWGRDSMISLPGLCLVTGRVEEAGEILSTFAAHIRDGLLPNHFPDAGEEPEYNTLDASLWFFQAIRHYLAAGGRIERVRRELYPAGEQILEAYRSGTRYNIHADTDGLIDWHWPNTALTWMDARVDDWAVTPRTGKPVEIQALWHGALLEMAVLATRFRESAKATARRREARRVRDSFRARFWNEAAGYLYDRIGPDGPDPLVRPNALFAASLPYDLLPADRARRLVRVARQELFTTVGLRSLAPGSPGYAPRYLGDRWQRDGAYHQGTVWGWLLGPFLEALWRTAPDRAVAGVEVRRLLEAASRHLAEDGVGSFAEVFDADPPHAPRGCPAQAWSVAELLRVLALVEGRSG